MSAWYQEQVGVVRWSGGKSNQWETQGARKGLFVACWLLLQFPGLCDTNLRKGLLLEEGSTFHSAGELDIMEFKSFLHGKDKGVQM